MSAAKLCNAAAKSAFIILLALSGRTVIATAQSMHIAIIMLHTRRPMRLQGGDGDSLSNPIVMNGTVKPIDAFKIKK